MNEYAHLINDYLCVNPTTFPYTNFLSITFEELDEALHNLQAFERPDMYSVLKDKIIILEHFEFDASRHTRKGMKGKQEESLLESRIASAPPDGIFHCDRGNYSISLADWESNFEQIFDSHYSKISEYKRSVRQQLTNRQKEPIVVGFFIENQYTPIVSCSDRKHEELYYFETVQFARKIADSPDLDLSFSGVGTSKILKFFILTAKIASIYKKVMWISLIPAFGCPL